MDPRIRALLASQRGVCSTDQLRALDVDEVALHGLVRSGDLVRLRRGLQVAGSAWQGASPERRLALRSRALLLHRPGAAASHASAAVIHGLPLWGVPPHVVDLVSPTPRRRSRTGLRLHPWPKGVAADTVQGLPVVPLGLAIAQVAAEHGLTAGLVCLDRALHEELVGLDAVAEAADVLAAGPSLCRRLASMQGLADARCESVGETRARLLLGDLGFEVRSQVEIRHGRSFVGRVDFLVGERVVVEFDGMVKYGGADGRRALQAEKRREDQLRDAGYAVVRLVWADLDEPERVLDLVQRAMRRAA